MTIESSQSVLSIVVILPIFLILQPMLDISTKPYYNRDTISYYEGGKGLDKDYETVRRIMLATNKIDGAYYYFARRLGVNENTLAFLYALDDEENHSQKEVSDEWLIPRTTINTIVKSMVAQGYISLDSEHGTKEKAVSLTESGRKYADGLLKDIYVAEERAIRDTLQNFSPEFVEALEYFASRLQEEFNRNMREKI